MMASSSITPEGRDAISQLFRLFLRFSAARSEAERTVLEQRMLQLFSELGVDTGTGVQGAFENLGIDISRIQSPQVAIESESRLGRRARGSTIAVRRVESIIRAFEAEESHPKLTPEARALLKLPVREAARLEMVKLSDLDASLRKILASMEGEPESRLEGEAGTRTSVSVIRAWWRNFCEIPPFCSRREQ